ncbi:hypothetical protein GEMRC1_009016 [Eukaryota sp. GEM-RC1]
MVIGILLLCCVLGSIHQWIASTDGLWFDDNNWDPYGAPSTHSSVLISPQSFPLTVTIRSNVVISSFTLSPNVIILFEYNSTLTISDSLILHGGTLSTHSSSPSSSTSVHSLILDTSQATLLSHKLIVTKIFDWKRGSIELDGSSELIFSNTTSTSFNDNEFLHSSDVVHLWGLNSGGGDVYTSGFNNYGQLGYDGSSRSSHGKIQISNIIQIVASRRSSYALTATGHVFSWGDNGNGQLGLGDLRDRKKPNLIPNLTNIKQIAGRRASVFALTGEGRVFGWGNGAYNIFCSQSTENILSPTEIKSLQNIKFAAASRAAFFIKKDGSTLTCGQDLGESESTFSTPTCFTSDIQFTFIDVTLNHALGIDINHVLWSWGSNEFGRLGTGDTTDSVVPVKVTEIGKVVTAAAGWYHSIAVDVINDVWSWGRNYDGALGRVTFFTYQRHTPDRVTGKIEQELTGTSASSDSNFVFSSVPIDTITSSNDGVMTVNGTNSIVGFNDNDDPFFNLFSLPVVISGSLDLINGAFIFLSETHLNGIMSVNSEKETYLYSLTFGASECSTLILKSNVLVENLYYYCGAIEGIEMLTVNTLVFCDSNPKPFLME